KASRRPSPSRIATRSTGGAAWTSTASAGAIAARQKLRPRDPASGYQRSQVSSAVSAIAQRSCRDRGRLSLQLPVAALVLDDLGDAVLHVAAQVPARAQRGCGGRARLLDAAALPGQLLDDRQAAVRRVGRRVAALVQHRHPAAAELA